MKMAPDKMINYCESTMMGAMQQGVVDMNEMDLLWAIITRLSYNWVIILCASFHLRFLCWTSLLFLPAPFWRYPRGGYPAWCLLCPFRWGTSILLRAPCSPGSSWIAFNRTWTSPPSTQGTKYKSRDEAIQAFLGPWGLFCWWGRFEALAFWISCFCFQVSSWII